MLCCRFYLCLFTGGAPLQLPKVSLEGRRDGRERRRGGGGSKRGRRGEKGKKVKERRGEGKERVGEGKRLKGKKRGCNHGTVTHETYVHSVGRCLHGRAHSITQCECSIAPNYYHTLAFGGRAVL